MIESALLDGHTSPKVSIKKCFVPPEGLKDALLQAKEGWQHGSSGRVPAYQEGVHLPVPSKK
jgi:hypothetical protein